MWLALMLVEIYMTALEMADKKVVEKARRKDLEYFEDVAPTVLELASVIHHPRELHLSLLHYLYFRHRSRHFHLPRNRNTQIIIQL